MALMNLFLHNIGDFESESFISPADTLITDTGLRVDYVLPEYKRIVDNNVAISLF